MHPCLRYVAERKADIVKFIRELVEIESPSDSPADVDRLVRLIVDRTSDIAIAETVEVAGFGKHLRLTFRLNGTEKRGQILALGHSDTVWPVGTLRRMQVREEDDRLFGPGVLDMKSGLAFFIYAIRALRDLNMPVRRDVIMLIVSDEEIGSPSSRAFTEEEAKHSDFVLVAEPGTGPIGKLKTSRKGLGDFTITVQGRAAHAGLDFENGANAIVEVARQIERITAFTDLASGITVSPGVIRGGTRPNVVPDEARVDIDVRVMRKEDGAQLESKFRNLTPIDPRCKLHVEGGFHRPPMERSEGIAQLFGKAQGLGNEIGVTVEESSSGGGSDGNFTASLGIPTLDGLGGVGEGAHAAHESIFLDRIVDRVALLAALVREL